MIDSTYMVMESFRDGLRCDGLGRDCGRRSRATNAVFLYGSVWFYMVLYGFV